MFQLAPTFHLGEKLHNIHLDFSVLKSEARLKINETRFFIENLRQRGNYLEFLSQEKGWRTGNDSSQDGIRPSILDLDEIWRDIDWTGLLNQDLFQWCHVEMKEFVQFPSDRHKSRPTANLVIIKGGKLAISRDSTGYRTKVGPKTRCFIWISLAIGSASFVLGCFKFVFVVGMIFYNRWASLPRWFKVNPRNGFVNLGVMFFVSFSYELQIGTSWGDSRSSRGCRQVALLSSTSVDYSFIST